MRDIGLFLDAPDGLEDDHGDDEEEHPQEEAEEGQATFSCLWVTRIWANIGKVWEM